MDIDRNKLRRVDMTILLVFLDLMRHRKAVTVAAELGLTQSSISHTLRRLRDLFDDPLFLRKPNGLEPTALAVALEPQIREMVEGLNQVLNKNPAFNASVSTKTVRIAVPDDGAATLLPGLLQNLSTEAPNMRVSTSSVMRDTALDELDAGRLDLAIGYFWQLGSSFVEEPLYDEAYYVVGRQKHPLLKTAPDLEAYSATEHLIVSPKGDLHGIVDISLDELGLKRHVKVAVPSFFSALAIIAQTDLIATLPKRIVEGFADQFDLIYMPPPLSIRSFPVSAVRHRRDENNLMHHWLIDILQGKK